MPIEALATLEARVLPYRTLIERLAALYSGERNGLANAANLASLLFHSLPNLNWAGVYLLRAGELVLGPFQGKTACVRIALGRGVCGTAAERCSTIVVNDVHRFPGHIACDSESRSEIVVPLLREQRLYGVLDLDSPIVGRFDQTDREGLEAVVALFLRASDLDDVSDSMPALT